MVEESERALFGEIRQLIEEIKSPNSYDTLAAELARQWAEFYDDTWVWGGKANPLFAKRI